MKYQDFFINYMGSTRKKNIAAHSWTSQFSKIRNKFPNNNRRTFRLPKPKKLPDEFIRLCPWEAEYLFTIAAQATRGIVEIGRFNGGSRLVFSCAAPEVDIFSIDKAPQDDDRLRRLMEENAIGRNVTLIIDDSQAMATDHIPVCDLLFIDGDHSFEGCRRDILNWYGKLAPNGHLLFHDSYFGNDGVQSAIAEFMATHPELQVIQSPFIGPMYWNFPAGSLAHFIKRQA